MCAYCDKLPTAKELGFKTSHRSRTGRALLYEAFRRRHKLTIDEICMILWPDETRKANGTISIFLSRMQQPLEKHGLSILRGIGKNSDTYRLGPA